MPKPATKKTPRKTDTKKCCRIKARRKSVAGDSRMRFVINIALVTTLFVGVVTYLIGVGNQATVGFTLSALDRDRAEVFDSVERSERHLREMQSVSYIREQAQALGMVEAQALVHLQPADTGVVMNR